LNWKAGLKDGHSTYKWANGDVYEGNFKKGLEDGLGTFTYADGRIENRSYKKVSYKLTMSKSPSYKKPRD